jgi:hypothetical protein
MGGISGDGADGSADGNRSSTNVLHNVRKEGRSLYMIGDAAAPSAKSSLVEGLTQQVSSVLLTTRSISRRSASLALFIVFILILVFLGLMIGRAGVAYYLERRRQATPLASAAAMSVATSIRGRSPITMGRRTSLPSGNKPAPGLGSRGGSVSSRSPTHSQSPSPPASMGRVASGRRGSRGAVR